MIAAPAWLSALGLRGAIAAVAILYAGWQTWTIAELKGDVAGLKSELSTCKAEAVAADREAAFALINRERRAMDQAAAVAATETAVRKRAASIRETLHVPANDDAPVAPVLRRALDGLRQPPAGAGAPAVADYPRQPAGGP